MNGLSVGFPGREKSNGTWVVIGPLVQRLRDELAAVVDLNALRYFAAQRFDSFHHRHHVDTFQVLAHLDLETFAILIID